ncbi:MAG TPA: hypothetical protein VG944_15565 [Fimbriimonas sp.]|nr:hypothetical protein [Fimbriimonas sp.]
MKAGVAIKLRRSGSRRRFVAGIHDTDYFAKLPGAKDGKAKFKTFPHNDTTTRGLWSAAGEFSALFGSETVVTREALSAGGVPIDRLMRERPGFLDNATEAWGWRGIVSLDEAPPVSFELPIRALLPELEHAFEWATSLTLESLAGQGREMAESLVEGLRTTMCDEAEEPNLTLTGFYKKLAPTMYKFAATSSVDIDTTATSELLRFNRETCGLPRFDLLNLFVNQETRKTACDCYNEAIRGSSGLYDLSRFGTGAIPFDLVIPGLGRGTVRLGTRGAVVMTRRPQFLSYKQPLRSVHDLAALVEAKFGPNCVLVGKAVALIGLLAREFVFVFHEGASSYVKHSRRLHNLLAERLGVDLAVHPILRVRYSAWDALRVCCSWLRLPEPLQRPFGTEELCAPSFAERWREVGQEQEALLVQLGKLKRPIELIRYLDSTLGGSWHKQAEEYEALHHKLGSLQEKLKGLAKERDDLYAEIRQRAQDRVQAEAAKGEQFRQSIFEKQPSPEEVAERQRLTKAVEEAVARSEDAVHRLKQLRKRQHELTSDPEVEKVHIRRRAIELEAELKRARLIRGAVTASRGLAHAAERPSAWWFPLVCPDGLWFRETIEQARAYLEPLRG